MLNPLRDTRSKLIQSKILNRLYWIPVRKYTTGMNHSDIRRCQSEQGDIVHMFLKCPTVATYWQRIIKKKKKKTLTAWV